MKTLTVKDAMAQIPDVEFENAADELLRDLDISFSSEDDEKFKLTRTHLRWMASTVLRLLEPVTIVEPPEEDEEMLSPMADASKQ